MLKKFVKKFSLEKERNFFKFFNDIKEPLIEGDSKRLDSFHFLHNLENPKTKYYIEQEDLFTQEIIKKKFSKHEITLTNEIEEIFENDKKDEYFKITSQEHSKEFLYIQVDSIDKFPIYYRIRDPKNEKKYKNYEELRENFSLFDVVLDQNKIYQSFEKNGKEKPSYFEISKCKLSSCENYIGFLIDTSGEENYFFYLKDLRTDQIILKIENKNIVNFEYSINGNSIYYIISNELKRPFKIFKKNFLNLNEIELEIFSEPNESNFIDISKTKDNVTYFFSFLIL